MRRLFAPLLVLTAVVVIGLCYRPLAPAADNPRPAFALGKEWRGSASCAAAACHNTSGRPGDKGSEYSTWVTRDPHARAYEALFNAESKRIARLLKLPEPAHETLLCLKCHVQPEVEKLSAGDRSGRRDNAILADGVGCEACHGPAERWLTSHYAPPLLAMSRAEKEQRFGMRDTTDLMTRAKVCVTCHVGGGHGDVNHDLIAAGHPRLAFEYAAYHANLPKHWRYAREVEQKPDIEAELWLIGRATSARAALRLLEQRAADAKRSWPEFAEYDCFACHHDLSDQAWRREEKRVKGRLGQPEWGTWYFALGDVLAKPRGLAYPEKSIDELRGLMVPLQSDREQVRLKAGAAAKVFDDWLPALRGRQARAALPQLANELDRSRSRLDEFGWDGAAQLYLGLAAQRPDDEQKRFLAALKKQLAFCPEFSSPKGFSPPKSRDERKTPNR
jgi:hypothetical protein